MMYYIAISVFVEDYKKQMSQLDDSLNSNFKVLKARYYSLTKSSVIFHTLLVTAFFTTKV